jgi:hypothetical protein
MEGCGVEEKRGSDARGGEEEVEGKEEGYLERCIDSRLHF